MMSEHGDALDQALRLMMGIDLEILKATAPSLIESAHQDAALFAAGNGGQARKQNGRPLASMLRLQESVGKLGAARVRVRDELNRRQRRMTAVEVTGDERQLGDGS